MGSGWQADHARKGERVSDYLTYACSLAAIALNLWQLWKRLSWRPNE